MASYEQDFHKRLRRLFGIWDDSFRVTIREEVEEGYQTCGVCDPDDYGSFDYGPTYKITIYVHPENGVYWSADAHKKEYSGMADLIRDLDEVEL